MDNLRAILILLAIAVLAFLCFICGVLFECPAGTEDPNRGKGKDQKDKEMEKVVVGQSNVPTAPTN